MKSDHSTHGQVHHPSKNLNTWTKDTKTKTCRCRICGTRVTDWSWKCSQCGKHICSVCCEDDPSGQNFYKQAGKDMFERGCWCKRFPSGMNPKLASLKKGTQPPKQEEQMRKDLEAKRKAAETSASKKAAAAAAAAATDNFGEGSSRRPGARARVESSEEAESSGSEAVDYPDPDAPQSLRSRKRRQNRRDNADGDESDDNVSDFELPGPEYPELSSGSDEQSGRAVRAKRRVIEESDEECEREDRRKESKLTEQLRGEKTKGSLGRKGKKKTDALDYLPPGFVDPFQKKDGRKKRKSGAAQLERDEMPETPSKKLKKAKIVDVKQSLPLEAGHTIIVGAGIVGLFTAYELAKRCLKEGIDHKVTVVEIRDEACQLASGQCAGFLTARGISKNKDWIPLLSDAQKAWAEIVRKVKPDIIGFEGKAFFAQDVGDADDEGEQMPSWFRPGPIHHVSEDEMVMGRVDTRLVAKWLHKQCKELGVGFYFRQNLQAVEQMDDGGYRAILGNPNRPLDKPTIMECSQMVVAAGPYTTSIVRNIFNEGEKTGLQNTHQQHLRIDVPHNQTDTKTSAAGLTIETTDDWSAGMMTMVVRPGSAEIEISAAARQSENCGIDSEYALSPQSVDGTPLQKLAAEYLGVKRGEQLEVADESASTVSVAQGGRPYVGLLQTRNGEGRRLLEMPNVWLSYGFGRYGTTLAPGAARMLVRRMLGQE